MPEVKAEKRQQCWLGLNYLVSEGLLSAGKALKLLDRVEGLFPPDETLLDSLRIRPAARQKLSSGDWLDRAEAELEKLAKKEYTLLTFEDDRYPRLLREVVEPPLVLYCFGQPEILSWAAVAV
ncbi:MAG TPA: hypothetical protein DCR87_07015, partial [Acidobacteria bacterium]|nr:hypothetical protein [Acidobacteriota bacterium]